MVSWFRVCAVVLFILRLLDESVLVSCVPHRQLSTEDAFFGGDYKDNLPGSQASGSAMKVMKPEQKAMPGTPRLQNKFKSKPKPKAKPNSKAKPKPNANPKPAVGVTSAGIADAPVKLDPKLVGPLYVHRDGGRCTLPNGPGGWPWGEEVLMEWVRARNELGLYMASSTG